MLAIIAGILLIIDGVITWLGTITLAHSLAIFLIVVGILIALTYVVPVSYYRRRVP